MKAEKMDLTKFEAMTETVQGALIGGFSAALTAMTQAAQGTNNCDCTNNCNCTNNCGVLQESILV